MEMKKTRRANVHRKRGLYFGIGLMISISLTITAFEWRFEDKDKMDLGLVTDSFEPPVVIPVTRNEPPKPKIIQPPKIEIVEDEIEIDELEIDLSSESDENLEIEIPEFIPEPEKPAGPEIFIIVEEDASFKGGLKAYAKFLRKNLKYPKQARRMGIQGKVYVEFIITKDGSLKDIKAIKGIGAGCDEEAVRVISLSPKWNPAKQRGRAVYQKMVIPIVFRLN